MNEIKKNERVGQYEMIAAMVICGTIGATVLLSGQNEQSLVFYRCLFGSIVLGIICAITGKFNRNNLNLKTFSISMVGGLALLLNWFFLFSAYSKISVGVATTVYNIQPFIMVFLCAVIFKEKINRVIVFWLILSFLGLYFVSIGKSFKINSGNGNYFMGIVDALIAAGLYAIASIAAKFLKNIPATLIAFLQLSAGLVLFFPFADLGLFSMPILSKEFLATATLGIVHTGIMYIFLYGAIQKLPAFKVASLAFLYPIIALSIDAFFFDVRLSLAQWLGIFLILLGAAGVNLKLSLSSMKNRILGTK